jgi:hypothetical protein
MEYKMSISTSTAAERIALRDRLRITECAMQAFAQDSIVPNTEQITEIDALLTALNAALLAADSPAASAVVTNGGTVNVENSAGALDSNATAVVANGVLTSVQLASTKTILTNALKFSGVTITGSGTFFTPTISAGVLTGGVLSAS